MGNYDHERQTPPTFAHRIHQELVESELERVEAERARGLAAGDDRPARTEARDRIQEKHGGPGPGLTVAEEQLCERCSPAVTERIARRPDGSMRIHQGGSTIRGQCPICPRHEQSWALVDLRDIDDPLRTRLRNADMSPTAPPGVLPPYACQACWTAWIRDGLMTKSEWMAAHGAPGELVEKVRGTRNDRSP